MMGYGYAPSAEHRATVDRAVRELMATQSADGYIGTYPDSCHLGDWDIWGRKYVLLGLLAYYGRAQETVALEAARRVADHLIAEAGPGSGTNIAATGWIGWKGLASCSVLEPITLLYQRTEKTSLDFARHIVRSWDEPNRLAPAGLRLIQEAIGETGTVEDERGAESLRNDVLFRGTVRTVPRHRRAALSGSRAAAGRRARPRRDHDRRVGLGSRNLVSRRRASERAALSGHGDLRHGNVDETGYIRCCASPATAVAPTGSRRACTTRCSGPCRPAGEWWAYYSGLMGERVHSHQQFPDVVMSCCVANGPRGLMITPSWAAMTGRTA